MASRLAQQKPDPAIQHNIIRARHSPQRGGKAQSFVIAASLAATLFGWAFFAQADAQQAAAQAAAAPPAVTAAPVASGAASAALALAGWSGVTLPTPTATAVLTASR